jgi:hypothetical protein
MAAAGFEPRRFVAELRDAGGFAMEDAARPIRDAPDEALLQVARDDRVAETWISLSAMAAAKAAFVDALNEGLLDEEAQSLRERVAREVPRTLAANGQRLSIHHHLDWDAAGIGFATATEMTVELGEGAVLLFEARLWYPGAALVRQLIECGYLLALMAEDRGEAKTWMTSTHAGVVKRFLPRHMRERAARGFRAAEYQTHCDLGGHPNPAGRGLLRRHDEWRPLSPRSHWLDLAQHLAEVWEEFVAALPLYDPRMSPGNPALQP